MWGRSYRSSSTPEQAYGHRDKSLIRKVPRSHVNVSGDLEVGLKLRGRNGSNVTPITVVEFDDETVTLDANNPLAGATLGVELVIVAGAAMRLMRS